MATLFYGAFLENTTSAVTWNQGCHVINVDTKIVIWAYHINISAINNYRSPGTLMPGTQRIPKQRMCLVLWLVFHFGIKQVRVVTLSTWAVWVMHVSNMAAVVLHREICILVCFNSDTHAVPIDSHINIIPVCHYRFMSVSAEFITQTWREHTTGEGPNFHIIYFLFSPPSLPAALSLFQHV